MSRRDYAVASTILFEIDSAVTRSKILHKIASGIRGDGLKIKRIAIMEKPFIARIYIDDANHEPKSKHWFSGLFKPMRDSDDYDYVVSLSIRKMPLFKLSCSYSIERYSYFRARKSPQKRQFSLNITHIRHSVSESILASLKSIGARPSASLTAPGEAVHMVR